ncbi:hypothetical protein AAE478_009305 [Parahypoxylon ruwenzoriense]
MQTKIMDYDLTLNSHQGTQYTITDLPEELVINVIDKLVSHIDILRLAQAGSWKIHRIAMYELLRTNASTLNSAIYWACQNGDISLLRTAIKLGAEINGEFCAFGWEPRCRSHRAPWALTPLTAAIAHQQIAVVEILLKEYGADSNTASGEWDANPERPFLCRYPMTPMQWALDSGTRIKNEERAYLTELLLDYGASPDPYTPWKPDCLDLSPIKPIMEALVNDYIPPSTLRRLVSKSTKLVWPDPDSRRGYWYYQCYLAEHCNLSRRDKQEILTPTKMEKLTIMRDAALDRSRNTANDGWTHLDFLRHTLSVVSILSHSDADKLLQLALTDCPTVNGRCAYSGQSILVVAVYEISISGTFCVWRMRERRELSNVKRVFQMLLDAGLDPSESYVPGEYEGLLNAIPFYEGRENGPTMTTALACLCVPRYGKYAFALAGKFMEFLVRIGVPVDAKDHFGLTALHFASKYLITRRVNDLIKYGADVNAVDDRGRTALHFACSIDSPVNDEDRHEECWYDSGESPGKRAYIVRILLENGADPSIADQSGSTPLHDACRFGFLAVVRLLVADPRVDVNAACSSLRTPLHHVPVWSSDQFLSDSGDPTEDPVDARINGKAKPKIARLLIDAGANTRAMDDEGVMPIRSARREGHYQVACILKDYGGDDGVDYDDED